MASDDDKGIERAIAGALRAAIRDHGPITPDRIGSATKRVLGNLRNARAPDEAPSPAASSLARQRWEGMSEEERAREVAPAAAASRTRWGSMTAEERSAEMKRRRQLGLKRKKPGPRKRKDGRP